MINDLDQQKWDEYLIPGTDVLKNYFNIKNKEELKEVEKNITRKTLAKLYLMPVSMNFNVDHLLEIHKKIFEIIYPFAGKFRTCSMQKNTMFCSPNKIEVTLKAVLLEMNKEFEGNISSIVEFAYKLAPFYYELIYIHPFREGNGRSIRTFIREFVKEKSKNMTCGPLDLDYTKIDKNKLMEGTVRRYLYPSYIETEFIAGLVKVNENTKSI